MADEPNLNVNVELDLNGADRALNELTRKADAFGGALSGVFFVTILTRTAKRNVDILEDEMTMDH